MVVKMLLKVVFRRVGKRIAIGAIMFISVGLVFYEAREMLKRFLVMDSRELADMTNGGYREIVKNARPGLDAQNLPAEPKSRDTFPCQQKQRFVFVKIHKAGSSTVTTMLERYGYRRGLNFALPQPGSHFFPIGKRFEASLVYQWELRDGNGTLVWPALGGFHALVAHARYNRTLLDVLIPNAAHFTIIREPVSRFESFFAYFNFTAQVPHNTSEDPVEVFLRDPQRHSTAIESKWKEFFRNGQLYMLGLEPTAFDDPTSVGEAIKSLSRHMDLVMLTEYFDESLVLLKRLMCWDFEDIVYIPHAVRKLGTRRSITGDMRSKIEKWNRADVKLYQHFNKTFWKRAHDYGPDFWSDVATFRELKAQVTQECLKNGTLRWDSHNSSYWRLPRSASKKCRDLVSQDVKWVTMIRDRMNVKSDAFVKKGNE